MLIDNADHVALVLSYSGKATFILPIIRMLFNKKIPVVLIVRNKNIYAESIGIL